MIQQRKLPHMSRELPCYKIENCRGAMGMQKLPCHVFEKGVAMCKTSKNT